MSEVEQEFIEHFHSSGDRRQFEDASFPADETALFRDPGVLPDYAARSEAAVAEWKRPGDWTDEPMLFRDGVDAGDVIQGALPDCWLLGAMAAVAAHPTLDLLGGLLVSNEGDFAKYGIVTFRFFKQGEWVEVAVDTRVPFRRDGKPLYSCCADPQEVWAPLLEKAYAKLHGSYEALVGGAVAEALADLTGGVSHTVSLTDVIGQDVVGSASVQMWRRACKFMRWGYVVACSVDVGLGETEQETEQGLLCNHAYSLLAFKEIRGLKFIKVRNPWGRGMWTGDWSDGSPKWDDNPEVEKAMIEDASLRFNRAEQDGTFWMVWEDFVQRFTTLHVCRVYGEDFNQFVVQGEWVGKTAGGAPSAYAAGGKGRWGGLTHGGAGGAHVPSLGPSTTMPATASPGRSRGPTAAPHTRSGAAGAGGAGSGSESKFDGGESKGAEGGGASGGGGRAGSGGGFPAMHTPSDGDPRWFNNPQYRVSCSEPADLLVALSQRDRRLHGQMADHHVSFVVVRRRRAERGRVWELDEGEVVADASVGLFASAQARRDVAVPSVALEPGYCYVVVPFTARAAVESSFTLRLFSRGDLRVEEVPTAHTVVAAGEWVSSSDMDTAGGPLLQHARQSTSWAINPQFQVLLPRDASGGRVTAKLVVRRTDASWRDADDQRVHHVALTVARCEPPRATNPRRKQQQQQHPHQQQQQQHVGDSTFGAGEGFGAGGGDGDALATTGTPSPVHAGGEGPTPVHMRRKLEIGSDEWCQVSEGRSPEEACTLLPRVSVEWAQHGLVVVPSLAAPHLRGSFLLEVHSDQPLQLRPVPASAVRTLASAWEEASCAGCHLHDGWNKKNPQFQLRLRTDRPTRVKAPSVPPTLAGNITLSRPEKKWRTQIARDSVGCMIGFYLVPGSKVIRQAGGIYHDGKVWNETPFVPMHSVATPNNFYLEPLPDGEAFTIVPATFEPKKKGPFFLTVAADCDFDLAQTR